MKLFNKLAIAAGIVIGFSIISSNAAHAASLSREDFNSQAVKFDFEGIPDNTSDVKAGNLSVTNGLTFNIGSFGLINGTSYYDGFDPSVIRFDFLKSVSAFGLDFIANNADITLSAFDKNNKLIESLTLDWTKVVNLDGYPSSFIGLDVGSNSIAYATIDTPLNGNELYIDNVIYQHADVPEPASIMGLLGLGAFATSNLKRRKKQ
jgi:PEP-CTERM motif